MRRTLPVVFLPSSLPFKLSCVVQKAAPRPCAFL
jgi:hypothetical protein